MDCSISRFCSLFVKTTSFIASANPGFVISVKFAGATLIMKHIIKMLNSLKGLAVLLIAAMIFFACKKEDNGGDVASIRVVYAVPAGAAADVLIDGQKVNSAVLNYPNNTGPITISSGSKNFKLVQTGTSNLIAETGYTVPKGISFSLFFYDNPSVIKSFAVEDPITGTSGKSAIRFFNLSPGSPSLDGGTITGTTFTRLFSNRGFENSASIDSTQNFITLDPGTYDFDFRIASTSISVQTVSGVILEAGKNYTLFKTPDGSGLEVVKIN